MLIVLQKGGVCAFGEKKRGAAIPGGDSSRHSTLASLPGRHAGYGAHPFPVQANPQRRKEAVLVVPQSRKGERRKREQKKME